MNRRSVLLRMQQAGRLSRAAAEMALADVPRVVELAARHERSAAPHFVEEVRQQVFEALGSELVLRGGLRIETTLDLRLQRAAVAAVRAGLEEMRKDPIRDARGHPAEGALLALEVASGEVLAMVGGYDFGASRFNRAVQARRQPGSAFKPFAYGAALELGFPPNATLYDYQVEFRDRRTGKWWRPKNYNGEFRGPVSMSESFARSLNNPTIRLVEEIGVDRVIDFARRAGIRSRLSRDLGLGLGTNEVTLLELTSAYGSFARGGRSVDPRVVRRVVDADGNVLLEDLELDDLPPRQTKKRISSVDAYLTTWLLKEAVQNLVRHGSPRRTPRPGHRRQDRLDQPESRRLVPGLHARARDRRLGRPRRPDADGTPSDRRGRGPADLARLHGEGPRRQATAGLQRSGRTAIRGGERGDGRAGAQQGAPSGLGPGRGGSQDPGGALRSVALARGSGRRRRRRRGVRSSGHRRKRGRERRGRDRARRRGRADRAASRRCGAAGRRRGEPRYERAERG